MKVKNALKNDKGSTIVVYTLALTAILGFCALVVDIGYTAIEKQKLQNAIDSAALAAVQELPNTTRAIEVAYQYMQLNGYDPSYITVDFSDSNRIININGTKTVEHFFAKIIGFENTTIRPGVSATKEIIGAAFNYALFSGSQNTPLVINGGDVFIDGSSHTNQKFVANGSDVTITGACEAVSTITINGSDINIENRIPNAPYISMPDFYHIIKAQAEKAGRVYHGNVSFNASHINIDEPIFVNGSVTINGSHFSGRGCILATGDIIFNGSNLNESGEDAVCFYSQNGNITINGSNATLDGIVYAPNGSVTMNGSHQTINGRVISDTIVFNGSNLRIISGITELESLPFCGARLIR